MTDRRRVHVDLVLPELTPDQAELLWNFLENLATDLWEAYEPELLELETRRSPRPRDEPEREWTADEYDHPIENITPPPVASDDTDIDF